MLLRLAPPGFWQKKNIISYFLLPFSLIYLGIVWLRRIYYRIFPSLKLPIPIIVVGNITVGGTGKTPLVIYLAEVLKNNGYYPGIISRGYGGKSKNYPLLINSKSKAAEVGDEPLLIARRTQCPVVVDPKRNAAVKKILELGGCNVVISDDGLQHYSLLRDIEIAVIDRKFGFGNGFCLPAGPLRERPARLEQVDIVIKNDMVFEPIIFYNLKNPSIIKKINEFYMDFSQETIHAIAGIGNPDGFFKTLQQLGFNIIEHPFPDHYVFKELDLLFKNGIIVMTEKDAVKCDSIANESCWCLKIEAKLNNKFIELVLNKLNRYLLQ